MVQKKQFIPPRLCNTAYLSVNLIILIIAIIYFIKVEFKKSIFYLGLVASFLDVIGLTCLNNAMANGPAGPVTAIVSI